MAAKLEGCVDTLVANFFAASLSICNDREIQRKRDRYREAGKVRETAGERERDRQRGKYTQRERTKTHLLEEQKNVNMCISS